MSLYPPDRFTAEINVFPLPTEDIFHPKPFSSIYCTYSYLLGVDLASVHLKIYLSKLVTINIVE